MKIETNCILYDIRSNEFYKVKNIQDDKVIILNICHNVISKGPLKYLYNHMKVLGKEIFIYKLNNQSFLIIKPEDILISKKDREGYLIKKIENNCLVLKNINKGDIKNCKFLDVKTNFIPQNKSRKIYKKKNRTTTSNKKIKTTTRNVKEYKFKNIERKRDDTPLGEFKWGSATPLGTASYYRLRRSKRK